MNCFPYYFVALAFLLCSALPTLASKAVINSDQVLVIDGKKIFPIGFTFPPPADGKTPSGKNGIKELADAGATFMRTGSNEAWDEAAFKREKKWMDAAAKNGMYCMPYIAGADSVKPGDAKAEALLRKILMRFKDHPGLGAWKGADEPEWGKQPVEPILRAYEIIKEVDPHHPVVLIEAPRGTVESIKRYNPACDVVGLDIYPIGYPPGMHAHFTNKEISVVGDYTRWMMEVAEGQKPVWMVLQIAWSGVMNPGKTLRFPTFHEERFMTYDAIINGARGLVYFGGYIKSAMSPEDAKLGWNWHFWNRVLRPVIEEIGTKSPLYPALLAPNSTLPIQVNRPDIEFCVREVGKEIFILTAKRTKDSTLNVEFTGLPENVSGGDLMFESPRKVQAKNGKFTDWFAPYEVHVYRFKRK